MKLKQLIYRGEWESFWSLVIMGVAILAVLTTVLIAGLLLSEIKWYVAP